MPIIFNFIVLAVLKHYWWLNFKPVCRENCLVSMLHAIISICHISLHIVRVSTNLSLLLG